MKTTPLLDQTEDLREKLLAEKNENLTVPRGEPKPLHQIHPSIRSPPPSSCMLITITWGYTNPKLRKPSHLFPSLILWISGHGFWFSPSPPLRSIYLSWPPNFPFWFRPLPLLSQTKRSQGKQDFFLVRASHFRLQVDDVLAYKRDGSARLLPLHRGHLQGRCCQRLELLSHPRWWRCLWSGHGLPWTLTQCLLFILEEKISDGLGWVKTPISAANVLPCVLLNHFFPWWNLNLFMVPMKCY